MRKILNAYVSGISRIREFSGLPAENSSLDRFAVLGIILTGAIFFVYAKLTAPSPGTVNGTYYSACCGNVVMRDGDLLYKGIHYKYDLENMKFGLTAYLPGNLTERGIEQSQDTAFLSFFDKDGKRGFDAIGTGQSRTFLKIK